MSGFIKYFKDSAKNMSFMTEDKDIDLKYSEVWDKIKSFQNLNLVLILFVMKST